ncbi:MAG: TolC family protein [Candidatus Brocadiia bacterium]|jgi:outer membrane protein TolC
MNAFKRVLFPLALVALAGCALRPAGEDAERQRAAEEGRPFTDTVVLPILPENPTPEEYLHFAFLRNADLHRRYWEWRAAIERIPQDSSFPNVALPFSVLFSGGKQKLWDRTTLGISNDPMSDIPFPTKLSTAGRKALQEARAAGLRFEAAKFLLQLRVLSACDDLALLAETIRLRQADAELLRLIVRLAAVRAQTGGGQPDILRAQTSLDMTENDLANLRTQVAGVAAKLNALLGRPATDPVPLPTSLPPLRPLPVADADLIRLASERSPALQALAREVAGKEEALSLAKQAYLPDFGLSLSVTGSVAQTLGGMLVLPTRLEAIRAGIEEARANLQAAAAARTQYERDLAASFVLNLYALRNDDRQIKLFDETIIPRARQMIELAQNSYSTGQLPFADLVEAERELLNARLVTAQLVVERDKALLAIESWSAVDAEAMKPRIAE